MRDLSETSWAKSAHELSAVLQNPARSSVEGMSRATKNITDFVPHKLLHFRSRRTEVFSGIKFLGIFRERFANRRCHGEPQVGINIHLGAADAPRNDDVRLRNTCGPRAYCAAV